ncbi:hypothetical protein B0H10DRAFT_55131 [Mycena sp. CBHHK59/15]|nr:hypothetical protein B0H10DRAFT_55131 [Mycena sp. CBHHK59/15]
MELTFVTDLGQSFVIEIDPSMELENVMALLEAEVRRLSFGQVSTLTIMQVGDPCRRTKHFVQREGTRRSQVDDAGSRRQREQCDAAPATQGAKCGRKVQTWIPCLPPDRSPSGQWSKTLR